MSKNIIDDLVAECSHVETPTSYLWWSFCTVISAVAGNNYYVKALKGDLTYRPNLYVMLLGDSGLGKGFPINRAKLLVSKTDVTRVIAGRSSIQAIVKELATARSRNGKPPFTDSRGFIVNGELSSALIADVDALSILTDLYDGHYNPEWVNLLKGEGAEKLKEPYIVALFGSSPAHFYDSIPQANIEGGYIGRNLIVYEEKRSKDTDLLDDADASEGNKFDEYLIPKYLPFLLRIAENKGQLFPTNEGKTLFNNWRRVWRKNQTYDKTGFLNRVPDHVLKVAMCIALARHDYDGKINEQDFQISIDRVTALIYSNEKTTEGKGLDPGAAQTKVVIDLLIQAPENKLKRKQLLTKGYGTFDALALDRIIENLLAMGWAERERFVAGKESDWIIKLAGEPLAKYKNFVNQHKEST